MAYLICLACLFHIPCLVLLGLLDLLSLLGLSGLLDLLGVLTGFLPACSRAWLVVCLLACLVGWLFDWSVSWLLTCSLARSFACMLLVCLACLFWFALLGWVSGVQLTYSGLAFAWITYRLASFAWLSWFAWVACFAYFAWFAGFACFALLAPLRNLLPRFAFTLLACLLCLPPPRFVCALRLLRYLLASHCLPFCSLTSFAWLPKNCLPCLVDWRLVDWRRELARLFLILNNLSFCKPTLPT